MTILDQYQEKAIYFAKPIANDKDAFSVYALGLVEETSEVFYLLWTWLDTREAIVERLAEELGDVLWYVSALCHRLKVSFRDLVIDLDMTLLPTFEDAINLLCPSTGKVAGLIKKHNGQGHDLNIGDVVDGLLNILVNMAVIMSVFGLSFEYLAEANLAKLGKLYENGFSEQVSRDRAKA